MAKNTRDNFDYENYARTVFGATDEDLSGEMNDQQRDMIYADAIKNVHELNLKDITGRGQKEKAIKATLNQFEDARSVLGIPEEIQDVNEPYQPEQLKEYLESINEGYRDLPVDKFVGKYTSKFYNDEYVDFQRPFLKDIDKSTFKDQLKNKYEGEIDFEEGTVSDAISKLDEIITRKNQPETIAVQDSIDEPEIDDRSWMEKIEGGVKAFGKMNYDVSKGLVTGFWNMLVSNVSGASRLGDALLNNPMKEEVIFDKETQEFKLLTDIGVRDIDEVQEQGVLSTFADIVDNNLTINNEPESFAEELAVAGGQLLAFIVGGRLGGKATNKLIGESAKRGGQVAGSTAMGINQGASSGYQDYINTIQETGQEFDADTAREVVGFNALIGASESIMPLMSLKKLTPDLKAPIGTFLNRIDQYTNDSVKRAIQKVANSKAGYVVGSGITGGTTEAGQEILATIASDWVANDIVGYDPDRQLFTDETQKAGEIGGILGAFINSLMAAAGPGGRRYVTSRIRESMGQQPPPTGTQQSEGVNMDVEVPEGTPLTPNETQVNRPTRQQVTPDEVNNVRESFQSALNTLAPKEVDTTETGESLTFGQNVDEAIVDVQNILEQSLDPDDGAIDDVISRIENSLTDVNESGEQRTFRENIDEALSDVEAILEQSIDPDDGAIDDVMSRIENSLTGVGNVQESIDNTIALLNGVLEQSNDPNVSEQDKLATRQMFNESLDDLVTNRLNNPDELANPESNLNSVVNTLNDILNRLDGSTVDSVQPGQPDSFVPPIGNVGGGTQQPSEPIIRDVDGTFIADDNGVVGVGKTQDEALKNLNDKRVSPVDNVMADLGDADVQVDVESEVEPSFKIETENLEEGGQRATLTTPNGTVVFEGEGVSSELQTLVDNYDPNDASMVLPNNLRVTKSDDGYELRVGESKVTSDNLQDGLTEINAMVQARRNRGPVLSLLPEEIPPATITPVSTAGFDAGNTEATLADNGFVVLENPKKSANSRVTPTAFRAYKNGFVYTVKVKRSGVNSRVAEVEVRDLDGNEYFVNANERKQEFVINQVLQPPVDGPAWTREINTEPGSVETGGIVLRQPSMGIQVKQQKDGGVIIDATSVESVAQRVGGEVVLNEARSAIIEVDGVATSFLLTEDGNITATVGNRGRVFEGPFLVTNTGKPTQVSLSVMTRELERLNYDVIELADDSVTLENADGDRRVLSREADDEYIADMGDYTRSIQTMDDFNDVFDLSPIEVDVSDTDTTVMADVRTETPIGQQPITDYTPRVGVEQLGASIVDGKFVANPDNMQPIRNHENKLVELFDVSDELAKVQMIDGKPTFVSNKAVETENGYIPPDVILNVDEGDVEQVLMETRVNATVPTDVELENQRQASLDRNLDLEWTMEDVNDYRSLLPDHINNLINIHLDKVNPASVKGTWGYFTASDANNRPAIHIDGYKGWGRTLQSILSTISEEVGHFSFDSWNLPKLNEIYDRAYDLVKNEAVRGLDIYIQKHKIDVDNPKPEHKWLLVNEFFSKQGTSFLDFDDNKIELPPGISRERMRELKKMTVDNITDITWDLTKDFKGDRQDGIKFIEDILRLQAGAVIGRGVRLTYKINKSDGTPATIEVNTTPYGSRMITTDMTEQAQINQRNSQRIMERSGFLRWVEKQRIKNGARSFVRTPIGNDMSLLIGALNRPASSAEAKRLRAISHKADRVRAWLDSVGQGHVPLGESYVATFNKVGLTKKRQLKVPAEMDSFMQEAFAQSNNVVAEIIGKLRERKQILNEMLIGHESAEVNLPKWNREIDLQIRRMMDPDWEHIAYEAYQPQGIVDINKMKDAMMVKKDASETWLQEDAKVAQKEIDRIQKQIDDGEMDPIKGAIKIKEHQKTVDLKTRLDALYDWAVELKGDQGSDAVYGEMLAQIEHVINNTYSYNVGGGDVTGQNVSALRGRKLDENNEQDRRLMTFLGRIEDPLRVAIANIEQRNKVLNNIEKTNELALASVKTGLGRPIGSTVNQSHYSSRAARTDVFAGDNAGLLNYIEFDPYLADFVKSEVELNSALERNVMSNWVKGLRFVKMGQTVLSPKLMTSNYTSNIGNLIYTGHLGYVNHFMEMGKGIKQGWVGDASLGKSLKDETFAQMIIREMNERNVIQTTAGSLDAQLMNSGVIEQAVSKLTEELSKRGIHDQSTKLAVDNFTNRFLQVSRDLYAYGDEWAKVLPYIVNRHIGVLKAKTVYKREDFADGQQGEIDYQEAIDKMAADIAARRTSRETVTWTISPDIARQSSRNGYTLLLNDYMMHPVQMIKVIAENSRMLVEDAKELHQAIKDNNKEYAEALRVRVGSRAIGNAMSYASTYTLWNMGIGVFGLGGFLLKNMLLDGEDDEDTPPEKRQWLTMDEMGAASRFTNAIQHGWGGAPLYPVSREGWEFTFYDGNRLAALNAVFPTQIPTTAETNIGDWVTEFGKNFINLSEPTLMNQLFNLVTTDKDRFGNEQTVEERTDELRKLFTPGLFKQGYELAASVTQVLSDPPDLEGGQPGGERLRDSLFAVGGVRTVTFDIRDKLYTVGYTISNQVNSSRNATLGSALTRLKSGEKLGPSEVRGLVKDMVDSNDEVYGYVDYAISSVRDLGMTPSDVDKYLSTNLSGDKGASISGKLKEQLIKGENGFHKNTLTKLKNQLDKTKGLSTSRDWSREQLDNRLEAFELAVKLYEDYLKD